MKNELIRLRGIEASEGNSALHGADFSVFRGEIVSLVGGFHSGKSLLMEIISGTRIPERGYRFLGGEPVGWGGPESQLRVKHLKKNFGLIGPMMLWENLVTYQKESGWRSGFFMPEKMRNKVQKMLDLYGVGEDSQTTVDELNSIQKFAVALIKARLEEIELILVESSELEYSPSGFRLLQRLLSLCKSQGISVVFSGINVGWISQLSDRLCFINAGRIIWEEDVSGTTLSKMPVHDAVPVSIKLNIPIERRAPLWKQSRTLRVEGEHFSVTGERGEFLLLLDPEQTLGSISDLKLQASFLPLRAGGERCSPVRMRRIDFSQFGHLVKWMSPADNLIFGLSDKVSSLGVVKPHLKEHVLGSFAAWSGEESYRTMRDSEALTIQERIRIAAFRLKIDKPDVVLFLHFQLLDQDSRETVLGVLAELLQEGTILIGISTLDQFSDFADGYYLMEKGRCSRRLDYQQVQEALAGEQGNDI